MSTLPRFSAFCLVLAPILLTVATGIDPALGDDQGYGVYRQHPGAVQAHAILLHWAWVLFVPGFLGLLAPIRRRGAILGGVAWVAVIVGLTTFSALMASDFVLLALEQNLPDAQVAAVDERFLSFTVTVAGWQWPGLIGWGLALILTPIAAARARVIGRPTAAAALLGTALYLAFAISPVPLCLTGPLLLTAAYTVAARRLLRPATQPPAEPGVFPAFVRRFGLFSLYAAPVAFAAGMATVPDWSGDLADSMAKPVQTQVSALLLHLAWVLFIPAVLIVAARANRFTRMAGAVTVVALVNFSGLMLGDSADLAARQILDATIATRVSDTLAGFAPFTFGWALPGMALSLLGLIAVAAGASASGLTPWWHAALVAAGVIAFLTLGLGPIGVTGPLLLLAGFGLTARALARTPDPAPDLQPAPPIPA
ncbi:hypothetical protein [Actinoplanes sp. NPDC023714]|uniref:hypothetical protein n=1 Tax=Actinoplanes sp. NPDC023714 TaxID=3154322 RepID=UPI0033FA8E04